MNYCLEIIQAAVEFYNDYEQYGVSSVTMTGVLRKMNEPFEVSWKNIDGWKATKKTKANKVHVIDKLHLSAVMDIHEVVN